jgi:hypothetical protein
MRCFSLRGSHGWCFHLRARSGRKPATEQWTPGARASPGSRRPRTRLRKPGRANGSSGLRLALLRPRHPGGSGNAAWPQSAMHEQRHLSPGPQRSGLPGTIPPNDTCGADRGQDPTRVWPTSRRRAERLRPWPVCTVRFLSNRRVPPSPLLSTGSGFRIRPGHPKHRDRLGLWSQRPRRRWTRTS